jgi:hypothetical protein
MLSEWWHMRQQPNDPPPPRRIRGSREADLFRNVVGIRAGETGLDLILRTASGPKQIELGKKFLLCPAKR